MALEDTQPAEVSCGNVEQGAAEGEVTQGDTVELGADVLLTQIAKTVEAGVGRVLVAFEEKLRYDQAQQIQLDRLHAELQEHRADLLAKVTRPLVYGMIRIHSDIGRLCSALCQEEAEEEQMSLRFIELLRKLREDVELELEKHGIVAIRDDRGAVDPRRQRVVRRTLVGNPELDGVVEASISSGFEQGEYVLVKESVSAYKFDPTFNEGGDDETED